MSRAQPLTMTNNSSLNGREIVTGDTIIMPMASRMFDTMMSIAMNGRYTRKPIWNARVSSDTQKLGTSMKKLRSSTLAGTFTVAFFPAEYRRALGYLGSHSGRDGDKVAAAGLTPVALGDGVSFREAELSFVCHKLYEAPFEREGLAAEINEFYTCWEPHWMFVGEITGVEDRR